MRYIYSILFYLSLPFVCLALKRKARENPQYFSFINERFGFKLKNTAAKPIIWLHAVSVGETRAMEQLVKLLLVKFPNYQLLITQMTPTGRAIAKNLYPNAILNYLPYDLPHAVINFYNIFKPKLGLIMETEIWPNLIFYANKFNIPLYLVNARLSNKSWKSYCRVRYLITPILTKLTGILCQDKLTYDNFSRLGYTQNMEIIGNTKFDIEVTSEADILARDLKKNIANKKVVIFASTGVKEEQQIIANLPPQFNYLIVIVPRHPERFAEVENLLLKNKLSYQKRSAEEVIGKNTQVFLGDSMGEMLTYYNLADIAVIGGSFNGNGGQNLLEPLKLNKPVIIGPSMYNFATITNDALEYNCAIQVKSMSECFSKIDELFTEEVQYANLASNCNVFIKNNQGASLKIVQLVANHLKEG